MKSIRLLAFFFCAFGVSVARADADHPTTGTCLQHDSADPDTCVVSSHVSVVVPIVAVNLATGKMAGGVDAVGLGPCYGLTWRPAQWYASGLDLCGTARFSQSAPNQLTGSLMLHVTPVLGFGAGVSATESPDGLVYQWSVFLAPRLPIQ
jgi:hypothetical protein